MVFARPVLLGFLFIAIGLAGNTRAADVVAPADRDKVPGPGDVVTIQIVEDRGGPVSKTVSDTGELDVPVIGRIAVNGRNCSQLAAVIKKQLEADYYNTATVKLSIERISRVKTGDAKKVFVLGQVKLTGEQEIAAGDKLTVGGAIVKAGGGTLSADLRHVKLSRKDKDGKTQTIKVDVKAILQEGKMDKDIPLEDGDFIFVPERLIRI